MASRISAGTAAITAVLGANGAGKTTLLRAISGMIRPRRGRVLLGGTDLAGRSPEQMVRAGIAHVPEGQGVIAELTVEENLRIGMMSWRRPTRAERAAALDEAYERFRPLADRRRKLAATLSGGERQMLVIARALLARPRVLLLDEPSLGLAPRIMAQVMDLVVRLQPGARPDHRAGRAERAQRARASPTTAWCSTSAGSSLGGRPDAGRRRRAAPPLPRVLATHRGAPVVEFLQFTLSGVVFGMIYAAIALSLVLIWRGTRLLNYAQGGMAMFTTYVAIEVIYHTGSYWAGFVVALAAGARARRGHASAPSSGRPWTSRRSTR